MKYICYTTYSSHSSTHLVHSFSSFSNFFNLSEKNSIYKKKKTKTPPPPQKKSRKAKFNFLLGWAEDFSACLFSFGFFVKWHINLSGLFNIKAILIEVWHIRPKINCCAWNEEPIHRRKDSKTRTLWKKMRVILLSGHLQRLLCLTAFTSLTNFLLLCPFLSLSVLRPALAKKVHFLPFFRMVVENCVVVPFFLSVYLGRRWRKRYTFLLSLGWWWRIVLFDFF